jgi:ubiquinone/menaquinone biosynthesis C-methylase UbiE
MVTRLARISEEALQRGYYSATAHRYDEMHVDVHDEHYVALAYISGLLRQLQIRTILDVGCGTGRALTHLARANTEAVGYGIEPVWQLLNLAIEKGGRRNCLVNGSGMSLPFRSNSFGAVLECGVLHHVREPQRVVNEMMRVAQKAVFLSDSNIFGQGRPILRFLKLALYRAGLWKFVKLIQTGGKGYTVSEGDGLAYSYSVYFQHDRLRDWADRVVAIPLRQQGRMPFSWSAVCSADTVLLCGIRE